MAKRMSEVQKKVSHFSQIPLSWSGTFSADGGQGDYVPAGSVRLGVWLKENTLFVHVINARDLPGVKQGGFSDPYIKIYLLPDYSTYTKRKTSVQMKTNHPKYDEVLMIPVSRGQIDQTTLWLSAWDWDILGRNLFLGEVCIPLSSLDLQSNTCDWYHLGDRMVDVSSVSRGFMEFCLLYEVEKRTLIVKINRATNLLQSSPSEQKKYFVTVFLYPLQPPFTKYRTKCVWGTLNPVWNEDWYYNSVTFDDLNQSMLEVAVWNYDNKRNHEFVGSVICGLNENERKSTADKWMKNNAEASHWAKMLYYQDSWTPVATELQSSIGIRFELNPDILEKYFTATAREIELMKKQGKLLLRLHYDANDNIVIYVVSAENLGSSQGPCNPYVTMNLLNDETVITEWTSDVMMNTTNPSFHSEITVNLKEEKFASHKLLFSLWNMNSQGGQKFLGQTKINLSKYTVNGEVQYYNLVDPDWYISPKLDKAHDKEQCEESSDPEIVLGLKIKTKNVGSSGAIGDLHVEIKYATGIPFDVGPQGYTKAFCKVNLLPMSTPKENTKFGHEVTNDGAPFWNEEIIFNDLSLDKLGSSYVVELTVWYYSLTYEPNLIGGVRIGPTPYFGFLEPWMDSNQTEAAHWNDMLSTLDECVIKRHKLRMSMKWKNIRLNAKRPNADYSTIEGFARIEAEDKCLLVSNDQTKRVRSLTESAIKYCSQSEEPHYDHLPSEQEIITQEEPEKLYQEDPKKVKKGKLFSKETFMQFIRRSGKRMSDAITQNRASEESVEPIIKSEESIYSTVQPRRKQKDSSRPKDRPLSSQKRWSQGITFGRSECSDTSTTVGSQSTEPSVYLHRSNQVSKPAGYIKLPFTEGSDTESREQIQKLFGFGSQEDLLQSSSDCHSERKARWSSHITSYESTGNRGELHNETSSHENLLQHSSVKQRFSGASDYEFLNPSGQDEVEEVLKMHNRHSYGNSLSSVFEGIKRPASPHERKVNCTSIVENIDQEPIYSNVFSLSNGQLSQQQDFLEERGSVYANIETLMTAEGQSHASTQQKVPVSGKLTLSLKFEVTSCTRNHTIGDLYVTIKSAEVLGCKTKDGLFVELTLYPARDQIYRTKSISNTSSPTWQMTYKYATCILKDLLLMCVLDISLYDENNGNKVFLGRVRLGQDPSLAKQKNAWMDCSHHEVLHWKNIFTKYGTWVEDNHDWRL